MKKAIIIITLICCISNLNAQSKIEKDIQKSIIDVETGQYYHQKSKKQKKTAWWLLGGGAGLFAGGVLAFTYGSWENDAWVAGSGAVVLGTVSMIASIPVFIVGAKNEGRANILLLKSNVPISMESKRNIPLTSVGMGIRLGK